MEGESHRGHEMGGQVRNKTESKTSGKAVTRRQPTGQRAATAAVGLSHSCFSFVLFGAGASASDQPYCARGGKRAQQVLLKRLGRQELSLVCLGKRRRGVAAARRENERLASCRKRGLPSCLAPSWAPAHPHKHPLTNPLLPPPPPHQQRPIGLRGWNGNQAVGSRGGVGCSSGVGGQKGASG